MPGSNRARRPPGPARYSALNLVRRGLTRDHWPRTFHAHGLADAYDAVIVSAGVHGLACA